MTPGNSPEPMTYSGDDQRANQLQLLTQFLDATHAARILRSTGTQSLQRDDRHAAKLELRSVPRDFACITGVRRAYLRVAPSTSATWATPRLEFRLCCRRARE